MLELRAVGLVQISTDRSFKQGDVVGVGLDLDHGLIGFYLNGTPAFRDRDEKLIGRDQKSLVQLGEDNCMRAVLPKAKGQFRPKARSAIGFE